MNNLLVSVIIPTRNSAKTLKPCLKSIVNQLYHKIEIIIVDQKSTDETLGIAKSMQIKIVSTTPSLVYRPPTTSRNIGAKNAKGYYLLHLDSDMILEPKVVDECVRKCKNGAEAIIIPEDEAGVGFLSRCKTLERACYVGDRLIEAPRFFTRHAFEKIGGYDDKIGSGEDWDIHERLRHTRLRIERSQARIKHLIGKFSLTNQVRKKYQYGLTFNEYMKKYPDQVRFFIVHYQLLYLRNWRKLIQDPLHALGMFLTRFCEIVAASVGLLTSTVSPSMPIRPLVLDSPFRQEPLIREYQTLPSISVVIPTFNCSNLLKLCLHSMLIQNYPRDKLELIIVDGGSTDDTVGVAEALGAKAKIVPEDSADPEGRKAIGLHEAKNQLILFIDSDNILPHRNWLLRMTDPFKDEEVVAAQPLRFHHDSAFNYLNRYFALIGAGDPVVSYLGKSDHLPWSEDSWSLAGQVSDLGKYYRVKFKLDDTPTLGANGYLIRRDLLLKTKCSKDEFLHIDVNYDLVKSGHNTFAFVKDDIIHLSGGSLLQYAIKRLRYMRKYYGSRARRYLIYSPSNKRDRIQLGKFIIFSLTLLKPVHDSIRGYRKFPDVAWFLHPIMCLAMLATYGSAVLLRESRLFSKRLKVWWHRGRTV